MRRIEQWLCERGERRGGTGARSATALSILQFEVFYVQKHNGRKLSLLHHMSIGIVKTCV